MLRVVDISSWQAGIDVYGLDCDAVIVKATGGTSYVNDRAHEAWADWTEVADAVLDSGKLLGIYHYAMEYGVYSSARDEARFFLDHVRDYVGRAVLVLDFEAYAQSLPVSWAREWLDAVAEETGARPWFYAYASYLNSRDHSEIAHYPLWMASYLYRYMHGGWVNPDNSWATSNWERMTAYQYSSTGRIAGYGADLDLSVFYGDRGDWISMQGGKMNRNAEMVDLLMGVSTEYVFGGTRYDIYRTDCSGIVCGAFYRVFGLDPYVLGVDTGSQWSRGTLAKLWWGTTPDLPWDDMYKGDLIFTSNCSPDFSTANGSHVGFYTGDPAHPFQSHFADGGPYITAVNGVYGGTEKFFGLARYLPGLEEDMRPAEVWEYNYEGSAPGGNCYNALMETTYAVAVPHDSATGDGTNGSMKDRIDYIDMRVREMHEDMAKIKAALENAAPATLEAVELDYEKIADMLAEKFAENLAARMKE